MYSKTNLNNCFFIYQIILRREKERERVREEAFFETKTYHSNVKLLKQNLLKSPLLVDLHLCVCV